MSSDTFYVIGEDTLKDIADSIKTKRGYLADKKIEVKDYASEINKINPDMEAFMGNELADGSVDFVTESDGVIRDYAFSRNTKLKTFTANSVTSIGQYAFSGCTGLIEFYANSATSVNYYALQYTDNPNLKILELDSATNYSNFRNMSNLVSVKCSAVTTLGNYHLMDVVV